MLRSLQPRTRRQRVLFALLAPPVLIALLTTLGPFRMDPVAAWGGVGVGHHPGWLPGFMTIDPNMGTTSYALGFRAALDLFSGRLPLWNHYEGLGAPLLGEMQSAALFPPTWLLLLPGGQAIEQALLQAVAGCGTFLFLRRFGLGTVAAVAGGLLFEFNGVFAWLRNAVYNPVAFLPWLFYVVESLFRLEAGEPGGLQRRRLICLGALVAAAALYAGFPELVYFYALLLACWAGLRAVLLPRRQAFRFGADLLGVCVLALVISAPLLIAFGHFLAEAAVGGHHGVEFRNHFLPPPAFVMTMLPYVFGPISWAPQAGPIWGDIGGYLGLTPLLLAAAGLACAWRYAAPWLLAGWIVLAVGGSHGVPVLHGALTALPLTTIAAYCRYLDASWIFAAVILGAIFVDRVDTLAGSERRRVVTTACVIVAALLGTGLFFAWDLVAEVWRASADGRRAVSWALGAAAGLGGLFLLALRSRRPARAVAGLAVLEAAAWFVLPFASVPRFAGVDEALIGFLRDHAGYQRFAIATGAGLGPNFGSVFGIPSMNYDDLPVPARTARYVTSRLDATNDGVIFGHNAPPASEAERQAAASRFAAALPGYAQAGVRYILSEDEVGTVPAYPVPTGNPVPAVLQAGQALDVDIDEAGAGRTIGAVSILIGTYYGAADGALRVGVCQGPHCAAGTAGLAGARDNGALLIPLDTPLAISPGAPVRISVAKEGGRHEVAIWTRPAPDGGARLAGASVPPGNLPVTAWIPATQSPPVLRTARTTVLEVRGARPYASAPGCRIDLRSHDRMDAHCAGPSRLLRLEVFLAGWEARVNGAGTPIVPIEDTFQGLDLPAGASVVEFRYAPWGVRPSIPIAAAMALICVTVLVRPDRRRVAVSARGQDLV